MDLAEQHRAGRAVRVLDAETVLDQAAASWLGAYELQLLELDLALVQVFGCRPVLLADELAFIQEQVLILLFLLSLSIGLLSLLGDQFVFGYRDHLNSLFDNSVLREECRRRDVCYVFGVVDVQQLVVLLDQFVRLERPELKVPKNLLVVIIVIVENGVSVIPASRLALAPATATRLGSV